MIAKPDTTEPPTAPAGGHELRTGGALASLAVVMLVPSLAVSIANVALPTIGSDFDAPFARLQWIVLAYLLAVTTAVVIAGRLGDLVGRGRLLLAGVILFSVSSLACGLAPSISLLISARFMQGMGSAVMIAMATALIPDLLPKGTTGRAMGLLGTMSAVGTAMGPSLGGVVIAAFGWRAIFLVCAVCGLIALGLSFRYLPRPALTRRERLTLDWPGAVLLTASLSSYALGVTVSIGSTLLINLALLLGAVAVGAAFIAVQKRARSPLVSLPLLRNRVLSSGLMTNALVSTVVMGTLVVSPFYLSASLALSPLSVGICLSVGPLVAALSSAPAGRLVDRLGPPRLTLMGLVLLTGAATTLSLTRIEWGVVGYVAPLTVLTLGYALFQAANSTAVMQDAGEDVRGVTSGMLNLSRNLGLITGASVMGAIFSHASAGVLTACGPAAGALAGIHATYASGALLLLAALFAAATAQCGGALRWAGVSAVASSPKDRSR
jgi:EmrB/QacA subfamily drug resistance transporter